MTPALHRSRSAQFRAVGLGVAALLAPVRTLGATADVRVTVLAPSPFVLQLNAVHTIDAEHAVAVGEHGTIVRTQDSGATWQHADLDRDIALKGVTFGAAAGVAVGAGGTLVVSADGGGTWARRPSGTTAELRATALGESGTMIVVGAAGTVLRSTDTGKTWRPVAAGTRRTLRSVAYSGPKTLTAVGDDGTILGSVDDGQTWQLRDSGTWAALRGIHFLAAKRGVIVGGDDRRWIAAEVVLRTSDGGTTWSAGPRPGDTRLYSVSGHGEVLITVGEQGAIFRSTDAGGTWTREPLPRPGGAAAPPIPPPATGNAPSPPPVWLSSVSFAADGTVMCAGAGTPAWGLVLRSSADERGWKLLRRERPGALLQYPTIAQLSADVWLTTNLRTIQRSTNGGATFVAAKLDRPNDNNLNHIEVIDASTAIAVGANGTVLRTTDAGASWKKMPLSSDRNLQCAAFANSRIGVVVGSWGSDQAKIFRSSNGGITWRPVLLKPEDDHPLWGVGFRGPEFGLAVGRNGVILFTRDGGETWKRIGLGVTRVALRSVALLDERTAVVVGEGGTILRTADRGATWTQHPSGQICALTSVRFSGRNFGLAVGTRAVLVTADGGITWQVPPETRHLAFSSALAEQKGAIVFGPAGLRLRLDLTAGEL